MITIQEACMTQPECARSILLLTLMIGLAGCETLTPAEFKHGSEILAGGQHSFAVYNDQHRLISDPLSELYGETNGKDISDVYVISHGWNFTPEEAYANYHNYMELLDRHLKEIQDPKRDPTFRPYFIFVVWPSVARPLGDIAHALLPFGLDKAIAPVTNLVDSAIFHIPSGWKESLNAFSVALGTRYPVDYERGLRDLEAPSIKSRDADQASDDNWLAPPYCGPVENRKTKRRANESESPRFVFDYYRVDSDGLMGRECPLSTLVYHVLRWRSLPEYSQAKIHLIGHSYGAKVVTLAGMEAIRLQRGILPSSFKSSITSLLLFNPAFHPRELHYWVRNPTPNIFKATISDEFDLLQNIPRKAIVYSGRDYATGRLFDLNQLIFANDVAQWFQVATDSSDRIRNNFCASVACAHLLNPIGRLWNGAVTLPTSVLSGVIFWSGTKIINIVPDWISHATQDDFYGFGWSKGNSNTAVYPRTFLNTIDYWIPFGRVATNADADKMGVLRTAIPALGSIGMDRLVAERWYTPLHGKSYFRKFRGDDTDRRPGNGTEHHNFCKVAASLAPFKEDFVPSYFYSYDATSVMDTWYPGAGSHSDVRSTDPPTKDHCANKDNASIPDAPLLEKRRYMLNFTYNFTRILPTACQIGASEELELGSDLKSEVQH
jgi:pimeloyl-ACP methyl ester carboxylesterase